MAWRPARRYHGAPLEITWANSAGGGTERSIGRPWQMPSAQADKDKNKTSQPRPGRKVNDGVHRGVLHVPTNPPKPGMWIGSRRTARFRRAKSRGTAHRGASAANRFSTTGESLANRFTSSAALLFGVSPLRALGLSLRLSSRLVTYKPRTADKAKSRSLSVHAAPVSKTEPLWRPDLDHIAGSAFHSHGVVQRLPRLSVRQCPLHAIRISTGRRQTLDTALATGRLPLGLGWVACSARNMASAMEGDQTLYRT